MSASLKGVSVVICCHNSESRVPAALASLSKQAIGEIAWEVIVVNNACTDSTVDAVKQASEKFGLKVSIVDEPTPGLMNARAAGVRAAQYSIVCFVDDDNLLEPNYIHDGYCAFQRLPSICYLGGWNLPPHDIKRFPAWFQQFLTHFAVGPQRSEEGLISRSRPWLWGAGLMVRRTPLNWIFESGYVFRLSGRQGDSQFAGDDSELCSLLAILGGRGYYSPSLRLVHEISLNRADPDAMDRMFRGFGSAFPILCGYWSCVSTGVPLTARSRIRRLVYRSWLLLLGWIWIRLATSMVIGSRAYAANLDYSFWRSALKSHLAMGASALKTLEQDLYVLRQRAAATDWYEVDQK